VENASRQQAATELLSPEVIGATAERLRVLGKAKSIALLQELASGEATVQELADRIGVAHQNASHHLSILCRAGVVARRSEGSTTIYGIEDWSSWWVIQQVSGLVRSPVGE
jgi:DNA-binding transcriptional ArsR family regulator